MSTKIQELVLKAKKESIDELAKMYPIGFRTHEKPIIETTFNMDGTIFFSASKDKKIGIYNAINFTLIGVIETKNALQKILITYDSELIFSFPLMGKIEVFYVLNGNKKCEFGDEDSKNLYSRFDYGNQRMFTLTNKLGEKKYKLQVYDFYKMLSLIENQDFEDNSVILNIEFNEEMKFFDVSLKGDFIYISNYKNKLYKYNDKGVLLKEITLSCLTINKVNFSKRYEFLIVCTDKGVFLLNPDNLEELNYFKTEWPILSACISPLAFQKNNPKYHIAMAGGIDAHLTTTTSKGGLEILVYNLLDNKLLMNLSGSFGPINHLEFFKDGGGLITAGEEGFVRIYRFDKKYFNDEEFN